MSLCCMQYQLIVTAYCAMPPEEHAENHRVDEPWHYQFDQCATNKKRDGVRRELVKMDEQQDRYEW